MKETHHIFGNYPEINIPIGVENSKTEYKTEGPKTEYKTEYEEQSYQLTTKTSLLRDQITWNERNWS